MLQRCLSPPNTPHFLVPFPGSPPWPEGFPFQLLDLANTLNSCLPYSSSGPPYDPPGFHQLLCQDSLCNVCNKASDQVSSQLSETPLEDSTDLTSQWPSTASVTESTSSLISHFPANQPETSVPDVFLQPSPSPLSTLSSYQTVRDGLSSTPLTASPSPHAQAPLDPPVLLSHTPHKPFAPFAPPHATQEAQSVLQPEAPLCLEESPRELSPNVPTAKGIVYEGQAVSVSSQPWSSAKDQSLTTDTLNQQPLDPCGPQASYQKLTETHTVEPRSSLPLTPEVLALFKRQEKTETDFTASEHKKEEAESFSMPLNNSGKISGSIAGPKNLEVSLPLGSGKGNSGDPHLLQQPSHSKTSEDQSGIKDKQLFWGPSCLHSESLKHEPEATHTAHFNRMAKTPTGNESLACTQPAPLPWLERDQQVWLLTLAESQTKPDSHSKSEALQPQIQWPLFSPLSQLRTCGVHFHRPSDGAQPLSQSEIHQLEYNLLQKALESVLGLPTVTQRSQESFCPPPPKVFLMRKSLKICDPKSILLGDFPLTREVRRKLEHHLRKRLIQHLWGLPNRVQDSLSLMSPHPEPSEFPEMQSSHGPWISLSKHNGSRHPSSFKLIQSESFHKKILETHPLREKDMPIQRQGPGTDQKDHLQRDSPAATMSREGSDSETDPELQPWILSGKFAKPSWVKKGQKKCETFLQEQLSRKTEEMKGGEIPGTKDRGPHSNNIAQPPPETQPRQLKDLAPLAAASVTLMVSKCHNEQWLSYLPSSKALTPSRFRAGPGVYQVDDTGTSLIGDRDGSLNGLREM
ncbi:spermatogenesis associated 31 subfamily D member 1A [Cricetulus griseus]